MKLTSFRLKDKIHLVDLMDVGLIDESWCDRVPSAIADRLRELIDETAGGMRSPRQRGTRPRN